jgi:UPF0755 protein
MSKRSVSCVMMVILAAVALLCLATLAAGWAWRNLPLRAEASFGPAAPGLGAAERLYLSLRLLQQSDDLLQPRGAQGEEQSFQVAFGESTYSIANRLQEEGLIADAGALRDYLVYSGLDTSIQAGEFTLHPGMTALDIARAMQDSTPSHVPFTVLPGWRLEEIAAALPTSGLSFSPEAFLLAAHDPTLNNPLLQQIPAEGSLEGFLFPGAYELQRDLTVNEFLTTFLDRFQEQITPELRQGFERQGLSLYQAVILASIVQREAVVDEEMPLIASVYLNRVADGTLRLDADPTVQYAIGWDKASESWWKSPLSLDDLQVNSPYNTYQNAGLPPGPIANPGSEALQAIAFPAQTPYYYFRAACDGSGRHTFARTLEEQVSNACP